MKIIMYDTKKYDQIYFKKLNKDHQIEYCFENLNDKTVNLAKGFDGIIAFVNTNGNRKILEKLKNLNVKFWFQRSMGYDRIDLKAAEEFDIKVFRVKNYSANTVAEHALSLMFALNRHIKKNIKRVEKYNFEIDGLVSKSLSTSTVGVIGAGQIGQAFIKIIKSLGSKVLVFDPWLQENNFQISKELNFEFTDLKTLLENSDIISIHAKLTKESKYLINKKSIKLMKDDVILVNISRGSIIDTTALVEALKKNKFMGVGLDVLEREQDRFFLNRSSEQEILKFEDPEWNYLINNEKVIITSHYAFLSNLCLKQIASLTLENINQAEQNNFKNALKILDDNQILNG